jgi:hypothetical protein
VTVKGKLSNANNRKGIGGRIIMFNGTGADNLPYDVVKLQPLLVLSQQKTHHQIQLLLAGRSKHILLAIQHMLHQIAP